MTRTPTGDPDREARARVLARLEERHRLHLALVEESRGLKRFTTEDRARAEIEIATGMLEGYLAATAAFLENRRGRYEARLPLLRRGDPPSAHARTRRRNMAPSG